MRLWLAFLLLITNLASIQPQTTAPLAIDFSDLSADYHFGDQIEFKVKISPADAVREVYLFVKPDGGTTFTEKIPYSAGGDYAYVFDLLQKPLRPFVNVTYWYRAVTTADSQAQSEQKIFNYADNRFSWQTL